MCSAEFDSATITHIIDPEMSSSRYCGHDCACTHFRKGDRVVFHNYGQERNATIVVTRHETGSWPVAVLSVEMPAGDMATTIAGLEFITKR